MERNGFRYLIIGSLFFLCSLSLNACKDHDDVKIWETKSYFQNNPLPEGQGKLRMLSIGNSFSEDALWFVQDIADDLGIDPSTYSVYYAAHSAASLQHWYSIAESGETIELTYRGGEHMEVEQGNLAEILAQDWDVITLQQYSEYSINYDTYNPWLRLMIDFIRQHCTNPNVTLAWQTAWSYHDAYTPDYPNYQRWQFITLATQNMIYYDGIDVIIPVGTTIQNARNTPLNTISQLTRDGWHLNAGIGRYLAACTVVQSLFAPIYGITIQDEHSQPVIPELSPQDFPPEPITEENRSLCHQCVINAVEQPFMVLDSNSYSVR